jgi:hypothetical protein
MLTIDLHLDLSMNALEWNRDLRSSVHEINLRESGKTDMPGRGAATVSLPDLRRGEVRLVVATQIARYVAPGSQMPGWHSPEQAWAQTQGQLAWYKAMEDAGEMVMITGREGKRIFRIRPIPHLRKTCRWVIYSVWKALIPLYRFIISKGPIDTAYGPWVLPITVRADMPTVRMQPAGWAPEGSSSSGRWTGFV